MICGEIPCKQSFLYDNSTLLLKYHSSIRYIFIYICKSIYLYNYIYTLRILLLRFTLYSRTRGIHLKKSPMQFRHSFASQFHRSSVAALPSQVSQQFPQWLITHPLVLVLLRLLCVHNCFISSCPLLVSSYKTICRFAPNVRNVPFSGPFDWTKEKRVKFSFK